MPHATSHAVTGLTEASNLDMAPNAFDDQYEGCVEDMERKAPQLLQEDFNMNGDLKLEWEKAEQRWKEIKNTTSTPEGFQDFHGMALVAYTGNIHEGFNRAVREFKKNPLNFHYKAFHYYLTRALQLLSNQTCYSVYRGTKNKFHYRGDGSVRFGQFASSTSAWKIAVSTFLSEHGTLFNIKTCLGVDIKAFSFFPQEEEVLIPVYEVYHKVTVTQNAKGSDIIFLGSPKRKKSNFNCYYSGSIETDSGFIEIDIDFSSSGARDSRAFLLLVVLPGLLVQLLPLAEL
ncbi:T-cell ecto-ADP-ribosyltransferase 2-like [Peromyscus californicus insignis]|uniref:T-cell ecto-ADP-ribosyltransferase 2-like n=1 Tax=Peromyscus californicus insignis TaxID=564181 RepID=UPI0022A6858F|nr:T-cell ecto-ADP-ribosyltransferase 2-like [Peromyscus californicus insignis]